MIIGASQSLNASSNLFQKSIREMIFLTKYLKGKEELFRTWYVRLYKPVDIEIVNGLLR
ncbi:MAG: hypothetical protein CM15mP106_5930 [Candidatus Neomarinimicrobiota bacterium]|nr:MAG: hypothetical protein CM15mP106_5930 [Candidatus Neomarinimicrobiota bacterium]